MTTNPITRFSRTAALAALLAAAASTAAHADDYTSRSSGRSSFGHPDAEGRLVDVSVEVQGRETPLYFRPGREDRHYFQAYKGRNYSLVLHNNTGRRVGVLIAVDGLNVVNGERSRLSHDEPMYVLDPYEEATIRGWRTSLDEVRRFVFVDEERSYAERTGQSNGDLGWIRVLAFREVEPFGWLDRWGRRYQTPELRDEAERRGPRAGLEKSRPEIEALPAPPSASRGMAENRAQLDRESREDGNPGTGWGERRNDPVSRTEFRAELRATDQIVMRYEYLNGLRALGIVPRRERLWDREQGNLGFAQPPRW